jgi:hypothetical protein
MPARLCRAGAAGPTYQEVPAPALADMLRAIGSLSVPAFPLPSRWPFPLVASLAMLTLAALDLAGALLAKAWLAGRSVPVFVAGVAVFALLFWVYGSSLQYAELATVTFGWVVLLQVGLLLIQRFHGGVQLGAGRWAAVVLILALQAYLILAPAGDSAAG